MSMEKNRIRPIASGKNLRMSYSKQKEVLEMPNLIEVQKDSYQWFLDEGLKEVFDDISPITDYSGHLSLEFVDFELCKDEAKYTIEKCKERDATYAAPLKVKVRLHNNDKDEINFKIWFLNTVKQVCPPYMHLTFENAMKITWSMLFQACRIIY